MAAIELSRTAAAGLSVGGRVVHVIAQVHAAVANWRAERSTRRALERLSDRELADIGLVRGDIDTISARILH